MSEIRTDEQPLMCVGFIMDGNRRWAEVHNLEKHEGHVHGYETLKKIIRVVHGAKIPHMVCYTFSTENWQRAPEEVSFLMALMKTALHDLSIEREVGVNYRIIGQREKLPQDLQAGIMQLEEGNQEPSQLTVWVALSYGSRAEIVAAANRAILDRVQLTEETFPEYLWTRGMPDPDLIVRTSGEQRLSNFLLWQSAYSELVFTETLWPDFGEQEFKGIVEEYGKRKRRKGT